VQRVPHSRVRSSIKFLLLVAHVLVAPFCCCCLLPPVGVEAVSFWSDWAASRLVLSALLAILFYFLHFSIFHTRLSCSSSMSAFVSVVLLNIYGVVSVGFAFFTQPGNGSLHFGYTKWHLKRISVGFFFSQHFEASISHITQLHFKRFFAFPNTP